MRCTLWICFVIFGTVLTAQSGSEHVVLSTNQVTTEGISSLAIDSMGYLWAGTSDGVLRYDGTTFTRFTNEGELGQMLHGNYVIDILSRRDGTVWVSTNGGGISIYSPTTNDFRTLLATGDSIHIQENRVTGIHEISGDSIVIHYRAIDYKSRGFSVLDKDGKVLGHHFTNSTQEDGSYFRFVDLAEIGNDIWIPREKLYRIDRSDMTYDTIAYPFDIKRWDGVRAVSVTGLQDESLLLGTVNGTYLYNISAESWSTILPDRLVREIVTSDGAQYIICSTSVYKYDMQTGLVTPILQNSQLSIDKDLKFNTAVIDNNTLWMGTNHGLYKYRMGPQRVSIQTMNTSNLPVSISSIKKIATVPNSNKPLYVERDGALLTQNEGDKLTIINRVGRLVHGTIVDFLRVDQHLFATGDGLYLYDATANVVTHYLENTALKDLLKDEAIWSIYNNGQDEILWIGTRSKGLIKYNTYKDTYLHFKNEPDNRFSLCFDRYLFMITPGLDGNLWITTDKGLSVINPQSDQFIRYPALIEKVDEYILHHSIAGDRYMWIGSRDHGLIRYDISADAVKVYTTKDGLPFTGVNRIVYESGDLVFITRKGVCILEEKTDKITVYDQRDGILHDDLYYSYLTKTEGNIHISGSESAKIYHISRYNRSDTSALTPIICESITTSTVDSNITYHFPSDRLSLSAKEDNISVKFTNIEFDQRNVLYRYMLQGYDDRWNTPTADKTLTYSHLPGGSYRLIIQAGLAVNAWQQETAIDIDIDRYWYDTWWFFACCTLAAGLLIFLLSKMYIDKIRVEESYRNRLVKAELKALRTQMNPHFIFNSLNSIKSFIVENDRRNASDYLNKFSKLIRLILNHSKSDLITLTEELQAISLYIDMERLRFASFDFYVKLPEGVDTEDISVPPMIIQPYLENAIWHGLLHKKEGHGKLELIIEQQDDDALFITIRDNGVGRLAASQLRSKSALDRKSHGMSITQERLQRSHGDTGVGTVHLIDLHEQGKPAGTEIQITLPYQKYRYAQE